MKKTGSINTRLAQVLFSYSITPQTTTGVSPSELLLGRRPKTGLDLLRPHTAEKVKSKQLQQKAKHDAITKSRMFCVGDRVFVTDFGSGDRWLAEKVGQENLNSVISRMAG